VGTTETLSLHGFMAIPMSLCEYLGCVLNKFSTVCTVIPFSIKIKSHMESKPKHTTIEPTNKAKLWVQLTGTLNLFGLLELLMFPTACF